MTAAHKTAEGAAPDRLLRLLAVMTAAGLGRTAVLDRVRAGAFPAPIKIGRAALWSSHEVQAWIAAQIAASRGAGNK